MFNNLLIAEKQLSLVFFFQETKRTFEKAISNERRIKQLMISA
jgi:hypothetical protein